MNKETRINSLQHPKSTSINLQSIYNIYTMEQLESTYNVAIHTKQKSITFLLLHLLELQLNLTQFLLSLA